MRIKPKLEDKIIHSEPATAIQTLVVSVQTETKTDQAVDGDGRKKRANVQCRQDKQSQIQSKTNCVLRCRLLSIVFYCILWCRTDASKRVHHNNRPLSAHCRRRSSISSTPNTNCVFFHMIFLPLSVGSTWKNVFVHDVTFPLEWNRR